MSQEWPGLGGVAKADQGRGSLRLPPGQVVPGWLAARPVPEPGGPCDRLPENGHDLESPSLYGREEAGIGLGISIHQQVAQQLRIVRGVARQDIGHQRVDRLVPSPVAENTGKRRREMAAHRSEGFEPERTQDQRILVHECLGDLARGLAPARAGGIIDGQGRGRSQQPVFSRTGRLDLRPEPRIQHRSVWLQGAHEHGQFAGRGDQETIQEEFDLRAVDLEQRQTRVKPIAARLLGIGKHAPEPGIGPAAIAGNLLHDRRDIRDRGCLQGFDQGRCSQDSVACDPGPGRQDDQDRHPERPQSVHPTRLLHHPPLRIGPAACDRSAAGCSPIPRARAGGGSRAWRSRAPRVPPAAARPGPGGSPAACGSASRAARGRGSRG